MKIDYVSPGDPNLTPNQLRELQEELNRLATDARYHAKIIVLPPGSKVIRLHDEPGGSCCGGCCSG